MADDKKNIGLEVKTPTEAPAPGGPGSDPVLTAEEAAILEHEGRAALFEMGEFVPDSPEPFAGAPDMTEPVVADPAPAEKAAPVEKAEPTVPEAPEPPKPDKEAKQTVTPDKGDPAQAPSGKVVDFAATREGVAKDKAPDQQAAKPRRGRPPREDKRDKPAKDNAKVPRDKMSQSKPPAGKSAPAMEEAPAPPEQPPAPRDSTRPEKEEIVYLNLSELRPFKNHPFGVRDDAEMQRLHFCHWQTGTFENAFVLNARISD